MGEEAARMSDGENTWEGRLLDVKTRDELLRVVRDFMATWSPAELQALPAQCRPGDIASGDDVTVCAYRLMVAQRGPGPNDHLVQRMAVFFSAAAHRYAVLVAAAALAARRAKAGQSA